MDLSSPSPSTSTSSNLSTLTQRELLRTLSAHQRGVITRQHRPLLTYPKDTRFTLCREDEEGRCERPLTAPLFTYHISTPNLSQFNKSDDFFAQRKRTSNNFSLEGVENNLSHSLSPSRSSSLHSTTTKGILFARQVAFNSYNQRQEYVLLSQIKQIQQQQQNRPVSATFLPPHSSLFSRGAIIEVANKGFRTRLPEPHGPSRIESIKGNYSLSSFAPVCGRGPVYTFGGTERECAESLHSYNAISRDTKCESTCSCHIVDNIKAQRYRTPSAKIKRLTANKNKNARRHAMVKVEKEKRDQYQHENVLASVERNNLVKKAARRAEEAEYHRILAVQRSWTHVVALVSRTVTMSKKLMDYQLIQIQLRASARIKRFFAMYDRRQRARRFLDARRRIRLFFEARATMHMLGITQAPIASAPLAMTVWSNYLDCAHQQEAARRNAEIVLTYLKWSLNRRKQRVMAAFYSIETKVKIIQRAWRCWLTVQRWRLTVQTLQFLAFHETPTQMDETAYYQNEVFRAKNCIFSHGSEISLTCKRRLPKNGALHSVAAHAGDQESASHTPHRYLKFAPPSYKRKNFVNAVDSSLIRGGSSSSRWNAMIRLMRQVFEERLKEENKILRRQREIMVVEEVRNAITIPTTCCI